MTNKITDIDNELRNKLVDIIMAAVKAEVDCPLKQLIILMSIGEGFDALAMSEHKQEALRNG